MRAKLLKSVRNKQTPLYMTTVVPLKPCVPLRMNGIWTTLKNEKKSLSQGSPIELLSSKNTGKKRLMDLNVDIESFQNQL